MFSRIGKAVSACLPPSFSERLKPILGRAVYFRGMYFDWAEARACTTGYDSDLILEKVKAAQMKVVAGDAAFERDSVLFDHIHYSFPVLTALQYAALWHDGRLSVLDYGGALGSSYFQCRPFLDGLAEFQWGVVEQANFVRCGVQHFQDARLNFFDSIASCLERKQPNVALLSSVLQYVAEPYAVLDEIMKGGLPLIVLDRTPFSDRGDDFITVQYVPKRIYPASYPCWIFDRSRLLAYVAPHYEIMAEFDGADGQGWSSGTTFTFGGMILRKRDNAA